MREAEDANEAVDAIDGAVDPGGLLDLPLLDGGIAELAVLAAAAEDLVTRLGARACPNLS